MMGEVWLLCRQETANRNNAVPYPILWKLFSTTRSSISLPYMATEPIIFYQFREYRFSLFCVLILLGFHNTLSEIAVKRFSYRGSILHRSSYTHYNPKPSNSLLQMWYNTSFLIFHRMCRNFHSHSSHKYQFIYLIICLSTLDSQSQEVEVGYTKRKGTMR